MSNSIRMYCNGAGKKSSNGARNRELSLVHTGLDGTPVTEGVTQAKFDGFFTNLPELFADIDDGDIVEVVINKVGPWEPKAKEATATTAPST